MLTQTVTNNKQNTTINLPDRTLATHITLSLFLLITVSFSSTTVAADTLPELLTGTWFVQKMEIVSTRLLTRMQQRKFTSTKRKLDKTNASISNGIIVIKAEFKTDSTYNYKMTDNQRVFYFERGKWNFKDSIMQAFNLTHDTDRSSFNNEKTVVLTNDTLIVEFTVLGNNSGIKQRIIYNRKFH